jgi:hypothetical protein
MLDTGIAALLVAILLLVIVVVWWLSRPVPAHTPQPDEPDLPALLDSLPEGARVALERMIASHEKLNQERKRDKPVKMWGIGAPEPDWKPNVTMLATELVTSAAPLAVELSRLEEYLGRYDLERLRHEANLDPVRVPLLQDLEDMSTRRHDLLTALEVAVTELESGNATRIEAMTDRLRDL